MDPPSLFFLVSSGILLGRTIVQALPVLLAFRVPNSIGPSGDSLLYCVAMLKTKHVLLLLFGTVAFGPTLASGQSPLDSTTNQTTGTPAQRSESTKDVLATVNGTPIGERDVRIAMRSRGHDKEIPPEHLKGVLEGIIRRELIYQRALELGLDANPRYQEELRRMEAQFNAFKREKLSDLFWRDLDRRVEVSEVEARKYFTRNAPRIRSELHVWQILRRKESLIEQARNDLDQGASFEEVASKRFPNLPRSAGKPWDLGYLRWNQVPEPWRSIVYNLKTGEVSDVIRGPNSRFWIIKLIGKRENPEITFESSKPIIMETVKHAKIEEIRAKTERDLRAKASIAYLKDPVGTSEE